MNEKLKLLWIEDDLNFGPSMHFRLETELTNLGVDFENPELLDNGRFVWDTVRDWKPDLILMDHNLSDVKINGANLINEIRFHEANTPIIFYSSEMDSSLMKLVEGIDNITTSTRSDLAAEIVRIIKIKFL